MLSLVERIQHRLWAPGPLALIDSMYHLCKDMWGDETVDRDECGSEKIIGCVDKAESVKVLAT